MNTMNRWLIGRRTVPRKSILVLLLAGVLGMRESTSTQHVFADPLVTVRVTIERVTETECVDDHVFGCGWADFYAVVKIADLEASTGYVDDEDDIFPDWEISKVVDRATSGSVAIRIDIWDSDGGLNGDDDHVDVWPAKGRGLDLTVDLGSCSVSGDVAGACGASLASEGDEADRARVQFKVSAEFPPSTADIRVRCIHDPIWPEASGPVTFSAEALENKAQDMKLQLSGFAADAIDIFVNDGFAPAKTCASTATCTHTGGPFSSPFVAYGCRVRSGTREVWSGWRFLAVGTATGGGPVPVSYTGPYESRIDIVFIADKDDYSGPGDSAFNTAVGQLIQQGYYSEEIFLSHQDQLNFWIAAKMGDAEDACEWDLDDWWDDDYSWAEAGAVVHADVFPTRDCAPYALRAFSTKDDDYRTLLHESGHQPFGLADEYCCDGGYYQTDDVPNVYGEMDDCEADMPDLLDWDKRLQQTFTLPRACREFDSARGWWDGWWDWFDWSVSDPYPDRPGTSDNEHLMDNNGTIRAADYRRMEWLFTRCASGSGCNGVD